ncbi:acyl-CoA thioesterase-2 [Corynebacterium pollutisoli]|uniref:Acyl-CoA thioesterase 2 n=1 Tax=Corynebacterium pollutisoli TaxID=1610489 RepID=A0A1X7K7G0_9CORY|nr:acyl-CoA thioesterase II [Corynebacterium pollutisoli]NLP40219.1 acyl-CoA thioesterase II [Corynebacterium pollutisoli]SMG36638.1 acyl-CoA thioesterase-2 [Corynebacterium pollutisoli]
MDIEYILGLEKIDTDIYRGPAVESELIRTFGGQVAAQALVAATETVEAGKAVHSLHGYFLAAGKAADPTVFLVDRLRDGRSFSSRQVRAVQNGETIFSMQASFHVRDDIGPEHSDVMRRVPMPEDFAEGDFTMPVSSRALLEEWGDWEIHVVPPEKYEHNKYTPSQQVVWFRSKRPLPDDERFHVCTLAYMSDMTLLHSSLVPHPGHKVQMASLDHAMWFLRPFRADDWLMYDQVSPSAHAGRALTHGRIFDRAGNLVAMVTQEGLTRTLRPGSQSIPVKTPGSD